MINFPTFKNPSKDGAALLVALWVLVILSLIAGSFAFEVQLEAMLYEIFQKQFRGDLREFKAHAIQINVFYICIRHITIKIILN